MILIALRQVYKCYSVLPLVTYVLLFMVVTFAMKIRRIKWQLASLQQELAQFQAREKSD